MQCPKCGSDHTQRLQVVFEHGTQNISTTSSSVGGGFSGALGVGVAHTKTEGTSQSAMAQKSAPPTKRKIGGAIFLIVVGVFMTLNSEISVGWRLIGAALVVGFGFLIKTAMDFNNKQWPELYKEWTESWVCNKCGNFYRQAFN